MKKNHLSDVDTPILVLAAVSKLHDLRKGHRGVDATRENIKKILEKIYNRNLSLSYIDSILNDLQKQGMIFKEKGLLRKKHVALFSINSRKFFQEAFTLIKLDSDRAYVVNRYEGIVYDPPSLETLFADANRWFPELWNTDTKRLIEDLCVTITHSPDVNEALNPFIQVMLENFCENMKEANITHAIKPLLHIQ